ncbi:B12-binding domain-containing radical SAM protein [Acidobacteria bacterium AH-259-D05]|nr:B12-binding domain-containing radical SAM protein [Acidobacteria bacterium AH-259-D05]
MYAQTYNLIQNGQSDRLLRAADKELNRLFPHRHIQRVLLVAPPDADVTMFNYATAKRGRYWNFAPYGLGAIATHLRNEGIVVQIINLNHVVLRACHSSANESGFHFDDVWKSALSRQLSDFDPDVVGITCMFTQTHQSTVDVCNEIKRLCPNVPVAVGGVHITNSFINENTSKSLLEELSNADLFFQYEAELAFRQFVRVVNRELPPNELAQVYFNSTTENLYFPLRLSPKEEDLNVIPAHDLMNTAELSQYGQIGSFGCLKDKNTRMSTVLSNRGCRAQCTFCSVRNFNGVGVRTRSVQSVIDELIMLRQEYGVGHIMWLDDDFLFNHRRALRLFNEMVRQRVGITWDCTNGVIAASCTEELIAAAAESGCIGLNIGMESGNSQILRDVKKPGNVRHFLKAAEVLKKYEQVNARVFLMLGFPGETYRMVLDTINVALEMDLDWYNITILQPLPNTPIFDSMVANRLLNDVSFEEIRYNSGPYGKHRKSAEASRDLLSSDFKDAFQNVDLDVVPPKEQLDTIWAYMNYHLNFKRLFREVRPPKLEQQLRYLGFIRDLVAPENAFAMYFYGYLQRKISGKTDLEAIQMLEDRLQSSSYWRDRFDDFGLSLDHLKTGRFPSELQREELLHASAV